MRLGEGNLRCQGCWVDVEAPRNAIDLDTLNRTVNNAREHGNSFFGILGGEPFMHPQLLEILAAHPDCYFQIFTNGHFITPERAKQMWRLGNVTPLISVEGTEIVSDPGIGGSGRLGLCQRQGGGRRQEGSRCAVWQVDHSSDRCAPARGRGRVSILMNHGKVAL